MSLTVTPDTTADEIATAAAHLTDALTRVFDPEVRAELRAEQDRLVEAWGERMKVRRVGLSR